MFWFCFGVWQKLGKLRRAGVDVVVVAGRRLRTLVQWGRALFWLGISEFWPVWTQMRSVVRTLSVWVRLAASTPVLWAAAEFVHTCDGTILMIGAY